MLPTNLDSNYIKISIVTPTLRRPQEVAELIENLSQQTFPPVELILVDGAPEDDLETQTVIIKWKTSLPYAVRYIRHGGGTAIQRNVGIDAAKGDFIAFIDDDIRLEKDYLEQIMFVFNQDTENKVGGVIGYVTNQYVDPKSDPYWIWYRRLRLFTTYEPGRYDFETGYPIIRYLQPPHEGVKQMDFISSGCAVWRKVVFNQGLRFSEFFIGYGILEDAHFSLRAARNWILLECGRARCVHFHSPKSRENSRLIAKKSVLNYRFVFIDIVPKRTWKQEYRFWKVQFVYLLLRIMAALRSPNRKRWLLVLGRIEGLWIARNLKVKEIHHET